MASSTLRGRPGRLTQSSRAPAPRGEPRRRDEQVEDVGPRGEAGGTDLCRNQDHNAIDATPARRRAPESVDFHAGARRAASRTSRAGGHTGAARIPRVGSTLPRRPKERRRWRRRLLRSPFSHVRRRASRKVGRRRLVAAWQRGRASARTSPASARSAAPRCMHQVRLRRCRRRSSRTRTASRHPRTRALRRAARSIPKLAVSPPRLATASDQF